MNPNQIAAATSAAPWNLILAGPGSGKTTVQVERARHLASSRTVAPSQMAFVTFTNIGANVLKRRLKDTVGSVGFAGTLHGMMFHLLRRSDPRWTMVDESDADDFVARHAKLLGYKGTAALLAEARRSVWDAQGVKTPAQRVVASYRQFMREEHLLDYDMVLVEGLKLLKDDPSLNPWSCWFVDEFQDSSPIDAAIYRTVAPTYLTICADLDQSIFGFRGARPANVIEFWNDPRFRCHVLDLNYRCAPEICELANAVVERNRHRIEKRTVSALQDGGIVAVANRSPNEAAERLDVCTLVRTWIGNGVDPKEIAVLCRTNSLASAMRDELRSRGLPVSEVETERKPRDWQLLQFILSQIAAPKSWACARLLAREQARILKASVENSEQRIEELRRRGDTEPAQIWGFPPLPVILSLNANLARYGIGKESHALLAQRIRLYSPTTIEELLEALRENPEAKVSSGVNVMTVHSAKGEEWNAVIVAGAEQFTAGSPEEMEEERRLFFVAVTRARRILAITSSCERTFTLPNKRPMTTHPDAGELYELASRMISEPAAAR